MLLHCVLGTLPSNDPAPTQGPLTQNVSFIRRGDFQGCVGGTVTRVEIDGVLEHCLLQLEVEDNYFI